MKRYLNLFKQTFKEFTEDKAPRLGAALAYYTVFSIAPMLLIAVSIAGLVFGKDAAQGAIHKQLAGTLGDGVAEAMNGMVLAASKPKSGTLATIVGVVTLLFGAAGVFGQLQAALDTIWDVEKPKTSGFFGMIKDRFLSMTMVFGIGFLLLVSLVIDTALAAIGNLIGLKILQIIISFGLITVLFALLFKYLPHAKVEWRDVWLGAFFTAGLFTLGKVGLGLYLGRAAVGSAYGAAGSLVVILIWVYWSAQILFFGAEFTQVYARTRGSLIGDRSKAKSRDDDRAPAKPRAVEPAAKPVAAKSGGGKGKLAVGGIVGLILGAIVGGITATIVAVKSVKKLITLPFK